MIAVNSNFFFWGQVLGVVMGSSSIKSQRKTSSENNLTLITINDDKPTGNIYMGKKLKVQR